MAKSKNDSLVGRTFVQIGAMKFPVKEQRDDKGEITLRLDFDVYKLVGVPNPIKSTTKITKSGNSEQVEENKDHMGLWVGDLLKLVDRSELSAPMLSLSIQDVETHTSRIVSIVRDDNPPSDGPGGFLWLHVDSTFDKGLTEAVEKVQPLTAFENIYEKAGKDLEEALASTGDHMRVEYDLNYCGGNYNGTGEIRYIPVELVEYCDGNVAEAFELKTGIGKEHVVYYESDTLYDKDGVEIEG